MGIENLQMLYSVATLLIVYELSLTTISSQYAMAATANTTPASSSSTSTLKGTEVNANGFTHINKPSITIAEFHRLPRHTFQGSVPHHKQENPQLKEQEPEEKFEDASSVRNAKTKRSFSASNNWASTTFNGLAGLKESSQLHFIRNSNNDAAQQPTIHQYQQYTEAKPIYEEQQENDYVLGRAGSGPWHAQQSTTSVANAPALHSAIYNLQTAGTHNAAASPSSSNSGSNGGSDGFLPSWNFGKLSTSFIASQPATTPYATATTATTGNSNDKISEGNFLHHYDSASAFNEYTPRHEYQSYQQQLQQQQQQQQQQQHQELLQKHENFYNSIEHTEGDTASPYADEHEPNNNSNYPPSASSVGHFSNYQQHDFEQQQQQHHQQEEKQPDVINYVPYPVVKKQHVPVREPVQIPISHAVIIPVSKPVPIHIPVAQNVQVPVQQDLKIPVERVVPYPVEKHVPVPVEKRVPYPIVKYVPIKVPRPFPVKVPVFKTVLHKVKGWW